MNQMSAIAVDDLGTLVDTRFTVPGIRCAGCIGKIEKGLASLEGVASARVNFSAKRVAVRHDERIGDADIANALTRLGFESQPVATNPLAQEDRELKRLTLALAVAGFGMMNIMLLSVSVWSGAGGVTRELFHWLSALIALPVVAFSGRPFFSSALMALRYRRTNMDVPISIGVLLATGLSFYETLTGGGHAYFDGAVMLLFFLLAGRTLDAMMRSRTRAGIGALLSKMGRSAQILQPDGSVKQMAAEALQPGMLMTVAAGEALAADGIVESGDGAVDNMMLTGESRPEPVGQGSAVHAGAVNMLGPLQVRITAAASDTVLAEIARLMDEAGQSRSRYVRIADRASRIYAPAVHSLALLAFTGWIIAGAGWHQSLVIAIAVLIITCPCALGLAVPAAQVVASNALVRRGLLVKDGSALERLAEVDVAIFDKTGTLTLGEPQAQVPDMPGEAQSVALALAQSSRHPLSRSLAAALTAKAVTASDQLSDIREEGGRGVIASYQGQNVSLESDPATADQLSCRLVIGDQQWQILFDDALRPDAAEALAELQALNIDSCILSGDKTASVAKVARALNIFARGNVSPADKLQELERLAQSGARPLMIGDGLNDAPALAAAHASIAPAAASDISQQAADAVFLGERLMPVVHAVKVARRTMRTVRQNFGFAIGYNVLAVPLALTGMVTPLIAAIAMSVSSLVVIANSLRLSRDEG